MTKYLKTKTVTIEPFGEIEIRQLSALAQIEMIEAKDKPFEGAFVVCKHGVPAWSEKSTDELKRELTLQMASDVADAVLTFSGISEKKSETALSAVSSSG